MSFHGLTAVASLKPRTLSMRTVDLKIPFHGLTAVASLKLYELAIVAHVDEFLPRPNSRGLIEAHRLAEGWIFGGQAFHGLTAVASLKPAKQRKRVQ